MPRNVKGVITSAIESLEAEYQFEQDKFIVGKVKQAIRFLKKARSDLEVLDEVRKLSQQKVIIVRPDGKVDFATNIELVKLAIMKESLSHADIKKYSGEFRNGSEPNEDVRAGEAFQQLVKSPLFSETINDSFTRNINGHNIRGGTQEQPPEANS